MHLAAAPQQRVGEREHGGAAGAAADEQAADRVAGQPERAAERPDEVELVAGAAAASQRVPGSVPANTSSTVPP